jgi:hypothetical protein
VELAKEKLCQEEVCAVISCFYKFYSRERKSGQEKNNNRSGPRLRLRQRAGGAPSSSSLSFLPKKKQKALLEMRQKGFRNVLEVVEDHSADFDPVGIACFIRGMGVFRQDIPKPLVNKLLERFVICLDQMRQQQEEEESRVDALQMQSNVNSKHSSSPKAASAPGVGVGVHVDKEGSSYVTAEHISDILESCRRRYGLPKMSITNRLLEELLALPTLREKDLEVVVRALGKNGNVDQGLMQRVVSVQKGIRMGRGEEGEEEENDSQ